MANTKKDIELAVTIIARRTTPTTSMDTTFALTDSFVEFFKSTCPRFDESRFRTAVIASINIARREREAKGEA